MGSFNSRFSGIKIPRAEVNMEKIGISDQFLENCETYAAVYSRSNHYERLYRRAFEAVGVDYDNVRDILDIGCGSGVNSTVPMLALFNNSRVIATDLSHELLKILQTFVDRETLQDRVACVCTDAMNNYFREASFDVVIGTATLHHLLDPSCAITAAYQALRSGGLAIFSEPFEGCALLGLVFKRICERSVREGLALDERIVAFFKAMRIDLSARIGTDKSEIRFNYMDDKWLFTRTYINAVAEKAGFERVIILSDTSHATHFHDYLVTMIRVGTGLSEDILPDWAWEEVDALDQAFSPEMKEDSLLEGMIILMKR